MERPIPRFMLVDRPRGGLALSPRRTRLNRELARFYERISPWILPHLWRKPLSLPDWPGADTPGPIPALRVRERATLRLYPCVSSLEDLLSLVRAGILEFHPLGCLPGSIEAPDRCHFDLDPGPRAAWGRVLAAARDLRRRLGDFGLESFVKTTGRRGLHVVAPLSGGPDWRDVSRFARRIARDVAAGRPRDFTDRDLPRGCRGRVRIDPRRNHRGSAAVAAYSVRLGPGLPVATPLAWEELDDSPRSDRFTVATLIPRLEALRADPWERFFKVAQPLPRARGLG